MNGHIVNVNYSPRQLWVFLLSFYKMERDVLRPDKPPINCFLLDASSLCQKIFTLGNFGIGLRVSKHVISVANWKVTHSTTREKKPILKNGHKIIEHLWKQI